MQEVEYVAKVGRIDNGWIVVVGSSVIYCKNAEDIGSSIVAKYSAHKLMQGDKSDNSMPWQNELALTSTNYYPKKGESK